MSRLNNYCLRLVIWTSNCSNEIVRIDQSQCSSTNLRALAPSFSLLFCSIMCWRVCTKSSDSVYITPFPDGTSCIRPGSLLASTGRLQARYSYAFIGNISCVVGLSVEYKRQMSAAEISVGMFLYG